MSSAAVPVPGLTALRAPSPRTLSAIAFVGAAIVVATTTLGLLAEEATPQKLLLYEWMSAPYVVAGVIAWWRRPRSRLGPLMIAGGIGTSLAALQFSSPDLLYSFGAALDILPAALFLHVFLAFPDGRLRSTFERTLVVATYVAALGLQIVRMSLGAFDNSFKFRGSPELALAIARVEFLTVSALLVVGVGVLLLTRRKSYRPRRRALSHLIDVFALGLLLAALLFTDAVFHGPWLIVVQRATWIVVGLAPFVFLLALLDAKLARSAVGDLIIELQSGLPPRTLQDALRRALRDPTLELSYWIEGYGAYVDLAGRPADVRESAERSTTLIERDGSHIAALVHDRALDDEPELLDAVSAAAAIALDNGRLQAELAARLEEVKESRVRVIEAGQKERQRLERDLHDGAQQRLVALSLQLKLLGRSLDQDPAARRQLEEAQQEVGRSLEELRDLARGIHPAVLTNHGLEVALEQVVARAPLPVRVEVDLPVRPSEPAEVAAYFVVTESLANIGKHAQATRAQVTVGRTGDVLAVEIADDGVGGVDTERGSGIRGLADRVEALGGRLRIWSAPGDGTRVRAEIPCG